MKRGVVLSIFGVLVFGVFIVARLPASWVAPGPTGNVGCTTVEGTIWTGLCSGLTVNRQNFGDLTWDVHPGRLLALKLNADVQLTLPSGNARAVIETALERKITAHDLIADLPIDPAISPQIPPDMRGLLHVQMPLLQVEKNVIRRIKGTLEARDLVEGTGDGASRLGSYSLEFPGNDLTGRLRDLGGPLQIEGTLKLTPEPGWELEGFVTPRASASAQLVQEIRMLGSPDAQGRRPFGLSGTF